MIDSRDTSFAPVDLPDTIHVQHRYDERTPSVQDEVDKSGRSSGRRNPIREPSYLTVENPAVNVYGTDDRSGAVGGQRDASFVWIRVLGILAIAFFIDVIILTIYVFGDTEPKGLQDDLYKLERQLNWKPLPDESQALTSLAFGSCSNQRMPMPYWDTLVEFEPDLFVMAGDNVYGDCKSEPCDELREAYDRLAQHPSFQGAKSRLSVVATLDDHDYGAPKCHEDNPHKDLAKQMFLDFFNIQDERRKRKNDGVYKSYTWGPEGKRIQLLLLDTRYHRSPFLPTDEPMAPTKEMYMPDYTNEQKRMLSDQQWQWLQEELEKPGINVRVVVSSIQVLADGHGFECWRMLPHERTRLVDTLNQYTEKTATFLVSGDRHVAGFYRKDDSNDHHHKLLEMTTSSLSHTMPMGAFNCGTTSEQCDEKDDYRLDSFVRTNNFGTIEIDWDAREVTLSLRQVDATTEYWYSHTNNAVDTGIALQSHTYPIP